MCSYFICSASFTNTPAVIISTSLNFAAWPNVLSCIVQTGSNLERVFRLRDRKHECEAAEQFEDCPFDRNLTRKSAQAIARQQFRNMASRMGFAVEKYIWEITTA